MDGDTDNLQMEEMLGEALKQPTDRDEPSTKVHHEQQEFIDDYNSSGNDTVINDHEMKQSITVITAKDNNHSKQNKSMDINDSVELKIAEHQEPSIQSEPEIYDNESNNDNEYRPMDKRGQGQEIELQAMPIKNTPKSPEYTEKKMMDSMVGKYYEFELDGKIINLRLKSVGDYQKDTTSAGATLAGWQGDNEYPINTNNGD